MSPQVGSGAGVPHYWLALARALSAQHEVHIFAAKADRAQLDGIKIHILPVLAIGWFLSHASFYLAAGVLFSLARRRERRPFDLVLGIGALTPFADVATVHFVQAREMELQQQGVLPRQRALSGLAGIDYALYSRTMSWLGNRFYRRSPTQVIAISESVARDLVHYEGARPAAIRVVPNGVDVQRFSPGNRDRYRASTRQELGLTDKQTAVLFVGNSWGRKGLRTAIEAISNPEQTNVRLVVVGEGESKAFTDGLSLEVRNRIIFAGNHPKDVERYYAAADVFLLPTLYEPFGLVILEALASGLPTIVSASAGASEWLKDGIDALLLKDPSDGVEAGRVLQSITTNPLFANLLAENARYAAEKLQWNGVAKRLIEATWKPALVLPASV